MVPEFLQHDADPQNLADAVAALLDEPERRLAIETAFADLRGRLALGADQRAAGAVIRMAERGRADP